MWNAYEGCCATECQFMALYGKTFDARGSNCCSGCHRYRCQVNGFEDSKKLAEMSTVEAHPKSNCGPEKIAMVA